MSIEKKEAGVWQISPPPPARPRRRNGPRLPPAQRREQLLDAARAVAGRAGLSDLTMQAVAQAAGVAKPVLYAVFPTAPELLGALLRREHARGMQQVLAALPDNLAESDPDAEYEAAVMAFLTAVQQDPIRWRLILLPAEGAPADYRELLAGAREAVVERCVHLLRTGIGLRGGPREVDVELVGRVMLGFIESLGRLVLSDPERFPPQVLRSTVHALARTLPKGGDGTSVFAGESVVAAWRQARPEDSAALTQTDGAGRLES
ncbi:TetR family transcriptional regulator [Nocardia sp. NPDC048505]|uniref:TetR/AcrR family transcriptional regulator n=1 Tax=unclassified Nocardia TaxID=2637762 RepID=UPI00340E7714